MTFFCFAAAFGCGSLMFSYWLGLLAGKNIQKTGDGNPGAFNLWNAAGYRLGLLGILLDFMKGYLPVLFLIHSTARENPYFVLLLFAPILGHAFSPFLKFRGGKSIAVTFGVWSAATGFEVSFVYAVILAILAILARLIAHGRPPSSEADGFMVVFGLLLTGGYLYLKEFPLLYFQLWGINLALFLVLNRVKLFRLYKTFSDEWREKQI
ncbi:glycerol-3-phosphate acyltransferase [Caproicibacter fermentans]|uniref:Glycerol-3-phosphate acyltransferase n=1 Tax=Caproicibacter fermentans TaxID=2576756 RepID=A0A7G8TER7_9FIRM|nr:glycerol-3-phosphate acyltransferase [Caproicibacter fermentans]QNK42108.1 glycerol-3-phosphate acyltransferase [Caproicibacter fermentans]